MPMMDMRAALTNPYTLDTFSVIRRPQDVDEGTGELNISPQTIANQRGVITPELSGRDLQILRDLQVQGKAIAIITLFALRDASKLQGLPFQPDLVSWHSNNYLVVFVGDYSSYARGFVRALAVIQDSSPESIQLGQPVAAPTVPALPAGPSTARTQHFPLESPDGIRTTFTFVGLPSTPPLYDIIWNGIRQSTLDVFGDVVDFGDTDNVPGPDDEFYGLW